MTIEQGLKDAGFHIISEAWLAAYENAKAEEKQKFIRDIKAEAKQRHQNVMIITMGRTPAEPDYDIPLNGEGDTAIYVLSRVSGEGEDRKAVEGDILLISCCPSTPAALVRPVYKIRDTPCSEISPFCGCRFCPLQPTSIFRCQSKRYLRVLGRALPLYPRGTGRYGFLHKSPSVTEPDSRSAAAPSQDPTSRDKNIMITFITPITRAAIRGGMAATDAFDLSDFYILISEDCANEAKVYQNGQTCLRDFTQRVHRIKQAGYSKVTQDCLDYIARNVRGKITMDDLSGALKYRKNYLSTKIHEETGMTIRQIVTRQKLKQASLWLTGSTKPIMASFIGG